MPLHPKLDFLEPFLIPLEESYRAAIWLLNDFDAEVWRYDFGYGEPFELDWRVPLADGTLLTDKVNAQLLVCLKYFLTACTRNSHGYQEETNNLKGQQRMSFIRACQIIDLLLINSKRYELITHGLAGLTEGNLIEILERIGSHPSTAESIYNWTVSLRTYCLNVLKEYSHSEITAVLDKIPEIQVITNEQTDDDELDLPTDIVPAIRACLYLKGYYRSHKDYGNAPNTVRLSEEIYTNCLWGKNQSKPTPAILAFNTDKSLFTREHPGVSVRTGLREKLRDQTYVAYRLTLYKIGILHEIGLPAPPLEALQAAEAFMPDLSTKGRFRTLPSQMVFKALEQGIDLYFDHGEKIINAFCRVALACRKRKISPSTLTNAQLQEIVGAEMREFGIKQYSLSIRSTANGDFQGNVKGTREEYYPQLRNNAGLVETLCVYVGAVQLTVGLLMARRVSEIVELQADKCLDDSEQWLIFKAAKSTRHLFGIRQTQARPIEPVAVDMIKSLIRMQKILKRIGYISDFKKLFSTPNMTGAAALTESSSTSFNRNLDLFCDYFETPTNQAGERYYIRQHQLRRFFAMLFFYGSSFGRLDTLQWMLGHTDPAHVWNYITETLDGAVLAGVGAQFVAEQIHFEGTEDYADLAGLISERFGVHDFGLIDTALLEDHILDLMNEGLVEIEPEFLPDHTGKTFKVVARLARVVAEDE